MSLHKQKSKQSFFEFQVDGIDLGFRQIQCPDSDEMDQSNVLDYIHLTRTNTMAYITDSMTN